MSRYVYKLPDIGEGIAEAEIVKWHIEPGTAVRQDEALLDVMTDKATVEIASPVSGTLRERHGKEGEKLPVGAALAVFDTETEDTEAEGTEPCPGPEREPLAVMERPSGAGSSAHGKSLAAPAVRARARELGLDLSSVRGSGAQGRILHGDLDRLLLARMGKPAAPEPDLEEGVEEIELFGLRRRIAERMQEAKRRIPHFTYVEEVDVEALEAERARRNAEKQREHLTLLPFLIRAVVETIARHPEVNCHYDDAGGKLRRFSPVHVGIATQTGRGLLVPVLRHAERLSVEEIASEIRRLATAARAGKSARHDLSGSTITVTSLGALGGIMATPIINPPELAIIGVNRIREVPVVREGQVIPRRVMNLSSSFDHRILDGFVAASFIAALRQRLEAPQGL